MEESEEERSCKFVQKEGRRNRAFFAAKLLLKSEATLVNVYLH